MKCQICDKEFPLSLEWLKLNDYIPSTEQNKLIMCNECVVYILETREQILSNELDRLQRKIRNLKED
jgi:hypothetical protein